MAITVPTNGTVINATTFGAPVANAINTTTVSSGAVASSGWSIVSLVALVSATEMWFLLNFSRNGSTISITGTGDIGNVQIATLPAGCRGSVGLNQPLSTGTAGRMVAASYQPSSGVVTLSAVAAGADIENGFEFSVGGNVRLNP